VDAQGVEITAQNGRYGPYLKKGADSRSLATEEQMFTVTLPEAEAIFAEPKQRRGRVAKPPLAELGAHPESGAPVRLLDGRFGPYVTDGTVNASIPRGVDVASVTMEQAIDLLRERAARAPATKAAKRAPARKSAKRTVKKTVKKSVKKAATKSAKRTTTTKTPGVRLASTTAADEPAEPAT
jgi:DNA topoisomerase-1